MNGRIAAALGLVIGSLAGGCYAPSFADCALKCSSATTCPADQICDGEFCRAPGFSGTCAAIGMIDAPNGSEAPDGSPDVDTDNDGITDDVDNCPTKRNMFQDNEDGDALGDACDPCPPLGPPNNADPDMDGVGGACDPNPDTPGDEIAQFEGFERDPANPAIMRSGNPTFSTGQMMMMGTGTAPAYLVWPVTTAANRVITSKFSVDTLVGTTPHSAGLMGRVLTSSGTGISCEAGESTVASEIALYDLPSARRTGQGIAVSSEAAVMSLRHDGAQWTCRYVPPGFFEAMINMVSSTNMSAGVTYAGIRARNAMITVDWVMIVSSP